MSATQPLRLLDGLVGSRPAANAGAERSAVSGRAYTGRLLLTGASGFVGRNLARAFRDHQLVAVTGFRTMPAEEDVSAATSREQVDLRAPAAARRLLERWMPDAVIHVAGNKNVRGCEQYPQQAEQTNISTTAHLAAACARYGAKFIYLSTDLVFDGQRGGYTANHLPTPNTVYGRTKRAGEVVALSSSARAVVCRTGGVYGRGSPLLDWLHREFAAGKPVQAFQDVVSTPTAVDDLAAMLERVLTQDERGILHLVGSEAVTRYEWFGAFAQAFGYDRGLCLPAVAGQRRAEMLLPRDVSLDGREAEQRLGIAAVGPASGLRRLRQTLLGEAA